MVQIALSLTEWEDRLHDSCLNGEDHRLVIDLVRWLKMGVLEKKGMQVLVIRNWFPSSKEITTIIVSTW